MIRRDFITLLLGGAAAWPLGAWAQDSAKLPTIGFLGANTQDSQSQWTAAFVQRLRELGWSEGRNIAIAYRWADGRADRSAEIAAEFGWRISAASRFLARSRTLPSSSPTKLRSGPRW
jgi:putative ABC transport system substrate-binding protein